MFEKHKLKKRIKAVTKEVNFIIAYKCPVAWEEMEKMSVEDKVRFSKECQLNVYNLLGLTSEEIKYLVNANGGEICGQVNIREEDNTVLFGNCQQVPRKRMRGKILSKK